MDVRRHPHYGVTFAILAIAGMSYALLQSLVLPALSEIQLDLGTTTTAAAWILTAYLLSASVATPIAGRRRRHVRQEADVRRRPRDPRAGDVHLGDRDDDRRDDRRPRDPGRVRRDLPARLRDHPRRVPGRAARGRDRAHLGDPRRRRRPRDRPLRPHHRASLVPLALLDPAGGDRRRDDRRLDRDPGVARQDARPRERARRDASLRLARRAATRDQRGLELGMDVEPRARAVRRRRSAASSLGCASSPARASRSSTCG